MALSTNNLLKISLLATLFTLTSACATKKSPQAIPELPSFKKTGESFEGVASWYGKKFQGRKTASGEIFNTYSMTTAHKTLPFGTYLRVTNLSNDKTVIVRVNDRGPFVRGRVLDLSYAAAQKINLASPGCAPVRAEILAPIAQKNTQKTNFSLYKKIHSSPIFAEQEFIY